MFTQHGEIKVIFLIPYAHCDYAWTHTRRWHRERYIKIFDEVLKIMEQDREYKWYFDTKNEQLSPFIRKYPQKIVELRKRVLGGRIEVAGGTSSNPKIDTLGGETFIRNMVYGRSYFNHSFGIQPQVYTAIDLMSGYSQIPQLLRKGGYKYFRFTRPSKNNLIEFYWKGLDGTEIVCSRGRYGYGVLEDSQLFPRDYEKNWGDARKTIYQYIKYGLTAFGKDTEEHQETELELGSIKNRDYGSLGKTGVVWLARGGDDCRPLCDFSGKFVDILGLVKEWNKKENIPLKFATPTEYFRELEKHKSEIPIFSGVLDSASWVCRYGILGNESLIIWWLKNEDALTTTESFCTLSSFVLEYPYPEKKLDKLWHDLLTTTGHAIRFAFANDYNYLLTKVKRINKKAKDLRDIACRSITRKIKYKKQGIPLVVFNSLAWDRKDIVKIEVEFERGETKGILLTNDQNQKIPYQIFDQNLYPDRTLKKIKFAFIAEIPSMGYSTYYIEKQGTHNLEEEAKKIKKQKNLENKYFNIVIDKGNLRSIFLKEKEVDLFNIKEIALNSLEFCILEGSNSFDTAGPFTGSHEEKIVKVSDIVEGPVCSRVISQGWVNRHRIRKEIIIYKQLQRIDFKTEIYSQGGDGVFKIRFPLGFNGKLMAHIPFGVEERELSKELCRVNYASKNYPHTFYAGRWIDYSCRDYGVSLISFPGRRGYDFVPDKKLIKHILLKTRTLPIKGCWRRLSKLHEGKGIHSFNYSIYPHEEDWKKAEVHRRALEYQNPLVAKVVREKGERAILPAKIGFIKIEPSNVVMTGFYKKSKQVIMRVYESQGRREEAKLIFPFTIEKVKETDFNGQNVESDREFNVSNRVLDFKIEPWEIVTFYITPSRISKNFLKHIAEL